MDTCGTLREIEDQLPNGFHDAELETIAPDLAANSVSLQLRIWIGDLYAATEEEREAYRKATLRLNDLVYFVIDPPGPNGKWDRDDGVCLDAGDATEDASPTAPRPLAPLLSGAFAHWFFVSDWNSFIHVAARGASLEWREE
jgi:hypothetical protein